MAVTVMMCTILWAAVTAAYLVYCINGEFTVEQKSFSAATLKSRAISGHLRRHLHQQDVTSIPDVVDNIGPSEAPLTSGPLETITAKPTAVPPAQAANVPMPAAFYWLADGNLMSYYGTYNGTGYNVTYVEDSQAGYAALTCSQANDSMVVLQPVPYGTAGPFAINVWVKVGSLAGSQFEYVFSQNSTVPDTSTWGPSQVQLYFPQVGHPAYGIVRGIVKDSTDFYQGLSSVTFLDSDGKVANLARNFSSEAPIPNLGDGAWHMITLTSQPDGSLGYRMYTDGKLAGQLNGNLSYVGSDGIARAVDGGKPLEIDGSIVLCGRSDDTAQRGFTGSLAELAIWNTAITAQQVSAIYNSGLGYPPMPAVPEPAPAEGPASAEITEPPTITPMATGNAVPSATPFPMPFAFFPLADHKLGADPTIALTSGYGGRAVNTQWVQDADVGVVVECTKQNDSTVVLDKVPYAAGGAWAVNLWMKPGSIYGSDFQYLFSHAEDKFYATGWESNQIRFFYPELDHPAFGAMRAIAKDGTDTEGGPSAVVFLDSDNTVGQLTRNFTDQAIALGQVVLQDAKWHMVTLTTLWDDTPGYAMMIDGQLAAVLNGNYTYTDAVGNVLHNDGGAPMDLSGPIILCGRSTNDTVRGYNGRITHLALFDQAITPLEAYAIYNQGLPNLVTAAQAPSSAYPASSNALRLYGMPVCWLAAVTESTPVRKCPALQACIPLSQVQIAENFGLLDVPGTPARLVGAVGVCTGNMGAGYHMPNASAVPPPMAFFPLTGSPPNYPTLSTYPVPQYSGYSLNAVTVDDDLFGGATQCIRAQEAELELDTVPYATSGAFTVNVWFQVNATSGFDMEYIFSHSTFAGFTGYTDDPWGANQVEMYFPESGHPAFGIFRAIVKDSTDLDHGSASQVWVDSDGKVAYNGARVAGLSDPRASSQEGPSSEAALTDQQWHMLTVSSQPDGVKGYRLYLDGQLVGQVANTSTYFGEDGVQLLVPGGAPAALSGPMHLCTRADNNNTRYFDGKVAYLGLYDQRLEQTEIMLLYQAVQAANATKHLLALSNSETLPQPAPPPSSPPAAAAAPVEEALALPPAVPLLTVGGQECFLPLHYNGMQLNGCVNIHGSRQPSCWVDKQGWQMCSHSSAAAPAANLNSSGDVAPTPYFEIPTITRITEQGNPCLLPYVIDAEIASDCVPQNGPSACYITNNTMQHCMPGTYAQGAKQLAAEHAAAARHRHHGGIVAGSVIGALAAVAVFAILLAALCMRKQGGSGGGPTSFRKFKDEAAYPYGGAPLKPYPGPPYTSGTEEAREVEMNTPGGSTQGNGGDGAPVQTPGTPARSFNGSETLGAGLANLRAASQRSASTSPEDPEVRAVKRNGKLPGMRSSETRIVPSGSATPPTERIY